MTLYDFFAEHKKVALAFSGGTDSSFLLYFAKNQGCEITPYFVKSQFQPQFEYDDAIKLCRILNIIPKIINMNILNNEEVIKNSKSRCYFCKKSIFSFILSTATSDGFTTIIDGTNASDDISDRPGFKALCEMNVLSPLKICGITKNEVRSLSKKAGLFTHNKPSYACLATRIPTDSLITQQKLKSAELAEEILKLIGFFDFRIRVFDDFIKLELTKSDMHKAIDNIDLIKEKLSPISSKIYLDLIERKSEF